MHIRTWVVFIVTSSVIVGAYLYYLVRSSSENAIETSPLEASRSSNVPNGLQPTATTHATTTLSTLNGFSGEKFNRPFQNDLNRLDPSTDGWSTESFSDEAMAKLKAIGRAIDGQDTRSDWTQLVAPEFQCTAIRPRALKETFRADGIIVRRSDSADELSLRTGSIAIEQAIREYRESLSGTQTHSHFKVFRVVPSADTVRTMAYFQLGSGNHGESIQVTATWECEWNITDNAEPRLLRLRTTSYEEVRSQQQLLTDETNGVLANAFEFKPQFTRGLDYWCGTVDRHLGLDIVGIHGLAVGDVNGDGLDDLYFCEPGGLPNRLYLHKPDGTARDISAVSGTDYLEATRSALFLDLDNDGDQDLVIGSDRFVIFCENDGFGRFGQRVAFKSPAAIVSMTAADYDGDGDLDIYTCGYFTKEDAADSAIGLGNPIPFHDANNGARNSFYRCDGNWRFSDVTDEVGFDADNRRFSLAAAWEDYDRDGDPDLYVANDYGRNCLYRNDAGHFVNVAAEAGVEDISAGMSVSWGDFNRDGLPDIYVSNMFSSAGNRISYQRQFRTGQQQQTIRDYQKFAHGNTLFANNGDGTFRDVTDATGVTLGRWAWASNFVDINNDGWEDLFVTNGMLTRTDPNDL